MKLINRIFEKTPKREKTKGKIATAIGTVCGAVLATGLVVNPIGIIALTIGAVIFGGKAVYHAQKTEDKETAG